MGLSEGTRFDACGKISRKISIFDEFLNKISEIIRKDKIYKRHHCRLSVRILAEIAKLGWSVCPLLSYDASCLLSNFQK